MVYLICFDIVLKNQPGTTFKPSTGSLTVGSFWCDLYDFVVSPTCRLFDDLPNCKRNKKLPYSKVYSNLRPINVVQSNTVIFPINMSFSSKIYGIFSPWCKVLCTVMKYVYNNESYGKMFTMKSLVYHEIYGLKFTIKSIVIFTIKNNTVSKFNNKISGWFH